MHLMMDAAGLSARAESATACCERGLASSGLGLFAPGARRWPYEWDGADTRIG
jgi:hypothetical protein